MATCTFHPDRETLVGCTRCARPACPDCLVVAPVGMQCRACVAGLAADQPIPPRAAASLRRNAFGAAATVAQRRPGWVFSGLVAAVVGLGVALAMVPGGTGVAVDPRSVPAAARWLGIAFVVVGSVLSVTLHEWGHAIVAYRGGDHTVVDKGYLTLDPRRYADPMLSLGLPVLFLLLGGLPLPGGAVWIEQHRLRGRWWRSAVSLAGVTMNLVFGLLLTVLTRIPMVADREVLAACLSLLALLQFVVVLINLLPVPGLDGYGVIEPHLPLSLRQALAPVQRFGVLILLALLWWTPALGSVFDWAASIGRGVGLDPYLIYLGYAVANPSLRR